MPSPRAVVTGIGVVNPSGQDLDAFWEAVTEGRSSIAPITRFPTAGCPVKVAAEIRDFRPQDFIPRRFIVKTDRFTHFALAAVELALADAKLDLARERRDRVGVWMGNDTGGWDLAERGFRELHQQGAAMVNPWAATAWFPTAPQGFITIRHDITGCSKSFVCDRATGGVALYFGLRAIRARHNDVALVGGTEAPLTPLGVLAYHETGEVSTDADPRTAYRPFDQRRRGLALGEGSTILVVESSDHARARRARVYGELESASMTFDRDPAGGTAMERALRRAIGGAGARPEDVDLVFGEGCGTQTADRLEARALSRVFAGHGANVRITCPKSVYGHLFGAAGPTDVACGLLASQTGRLPVTAGLDRPEPGLRFVTRPTTGTVRRFVVNARSREGTNVAVVVSGSGSRDA